MSKASARGRSSARARWAAAATPAAGPDIAIVSGRARAASTDIMPPAEWSRCSGTAPVVARQRRSPQPRDQVVDVARRQRHDRGVEHRRAGALVLAELGVDLAGDGHVGEVRGERQPQRLLVGRVRVGVEETDRDALHAVTPEPLDDRRQLAEIEGGQHRAVRPDALGDLGPEPPRHEGLGLGRQIDPVEMRTIHAADLDHVAEPARGDEADRADAALDDRVGDQRGAVGERGAAAGHAVDRGQPVEHAAGWIIRRRRHLERARAPGGIPRHQVGEGAAHVDAHAHAGGRHAIVNRARISSGRSE